MNDIPDGLHEREYAMYALENGIGRPATKANLELIAACIKSIAGKKTGGNLPRAMRYLLRAVRLAEEQYITVDYAFFADAVYLKVGPVKKMPTYKPMTPEQRLALEQHQKSPEWQDWYLKMDALLKSMTMPGSRK